MTDLAANSASAAKAHKSRRTQQQQQQQQQPPTSRHASMAGSAAAAASADSQQVIVVMATRDTPGGQTTDPVAYKESTVIGNGSFGVVYRARMTVPAERLIAIKKVLQDKHFKNREVEIMRKVRHANIVELLYFFYSSGTSDKQQQQQQQRRQQQQQHHNEVYLNLVLEYIPETVYRISRFYSRSKESIPQIFVKLYVYQLLRALSYLHRLSICHRDIKPQNLLIHPETSVLKLCDFGSAKVLSADSVNVSYICSRYYRAPELIFGAVKYDCSIDTWSAGCVFAELLLGRPAFPGDCGVNQLVEIIKVLGTPTSEQIRQMNPHYECFKFPQIKPSTWANVFPTKTPRDAIDLVSQLLEYTPTQRLKPLHALTLAYFDELRAPHTRLQSGKDLPADLFSFSEFELGAIDDQSTRSRLLPDQLDTPTKQQQQQQQQDQRRQLHPRTNGAAAAAAAGDQ